MISNSIKKTKQLKHVVVLFTNMSMSLFSHPQNNCWRHPLGDGGRFIPLWTLCKKITTDNNINENIKILIEDLLCI